MILIITQAELDESKNTALMLLQDQPVDGQLVCTMHALPESDAYVVKMFVVEFTKPETRLFYCETHSYRSGFEAMVRQMRADHERLL